MSDTYLLCKQSVKDTLHLPDSLAFAIHQDKSVIVLSQETVCRICYFFNYNDRLTREKINGIIELALQLLK